MVQAHPEELLFGVFFLFSLHSCLNPWLHRCSRASSGRCSAQRKPDLLFVSSSIACDLSMEIMATYTGSRAAAPRPRHPAPQPLASSPLPFLSAPRSSPLRRLALCVFLGQGRDQPLRIGGGKEVQVRLAAAPNLNQSLRFNYLSLSLFAPLPTGFSAGVSRAGST